jgi:hypothetical protein
MRSTTVRLRVTSHIRPDAPVAHVAGRGGNALVVLPAASGAGFLPMRSARRRRLPLEAHTRGGELRYDQFGGVRRAGIAVVLLHCIVGVSELALDDEQRHAFAGYFDGVRVPELVWRERWTSARAAVSAAGEAAVETTSVRGPIASSPSSRTERPKRRLSFVADPAVASSSTRSQGGVNFVSHDD